MRTKPSAAGDRARNGHADASKRPEDQLDSDDHAPDLRWSGRRESNPHDHLGRSVPRYFR